jgi:hypothetical protein
MAEASPRLSVVGDQNSGIKDVQDNIVARHNVVLIDGNLMVCTGATHAVSAKSSQGSEDKDH